MCNIGMTRYGFEDIGLLAIFTINFLLLIRTIMCLLDIIRQSVPCSGYIHVVSAVLTQWSCHH